MEGRYGKAERIWVMDRGMTSRKNLAWLRATGRHYLIGTPRAELTQWRTALATAQDWQEVRDGIEVKRCPGVAGHETLPLCRSAERREKERAMHERFATRIEAGLTRLEQRLTHARKALDRSTRARPSAHPRLFPGLRALEDARAMAGTGRARQQSADDPP